MRRDCKLCYSSKAGWIHCVAVSAMQVSYVYRRAKLWVHTGLFCGRKSTIGKHPGSIPVFIARLTSHFARIWYSSHGFVVGSLLPLLCQWYEGLWRSGRCLIFIYNGQIPLRFQGHGSNIFLNFPPLEILSCFTMSLLSRRSLLANVSGLDKSQ